MIHDIIQNAYEAPTYPKYKYRSNIASRFWSSAVATESLYTPAALLRPLRGCILSSGLQFNGAYKQRIYIT